MTPNLPNVTSVNFTRALKAAGKRGVFLGFSASSCGYCATHEAAWAAYADFAAYAGVDGRSSAAPAVPAIARVDSDRDRSLFQRYEVEELPAIILAWKKHWVAYTGVHTRDALAAFGAAHNEPTTRMLRGDAKLSALLDAQRAVSSQHTGRSSSVHETHGARPLLLIGFFNDVDDEADELEDFAQGVAELRRLRTDVAVSGAHVQLTPALTAYYSRGGPRPWVVRAPCAVLLIGGEPPPGSHAYLLDERDDSSLSLSEWAARTALPALGELSPNTFAAYAATSLPMLIAFVDPTVSSADLRRALLGVGTHFRGRLSVVTCDGVEQRSRMLLLGLAADATLPQFAINTKDGRRLPFPADRAPTERSLGRFATDFLADRLQAASPTPPLPPQPVPPQPTPSAPPIETRHLGRHQGTAAGEEGESGAVLELTAATFDRVALAVTTDVLLMLHTATACDACGKLMPYYRRVAQRAAQLHLPTLTVATLDVQHEPLPNALRSINLHALPVVLMLPARRKDPPFALFHGTARPKELLYFAQAHASHRFELPPNPHLTREQHVAWKEQVQALPPEKVERAYQALQAETGLERDEL